VFRVFRVFRAYAPAYTQTRTHARALTHLIIFHVYTQGTPGTPGTTLVAQAIPLFRVPGTSKTNPEHAMPTAKPGNLRTEMPTVAGWIDDLRAAFGAEQINAAIRAGLDGQPTFWASENGRAVGTKSLGVWVSLSETWIAAPGANAQAARGKK
jgi:hypothetical protein